MYWFLLLLAVAIAHTLLGARFGRGSNPQTIPSLVALGVATWLRAPVWAWWTFFALFALTWFSSGILREPELRRMSLVLRRNPIVQGPTRWALGAIGAGLFIARLIR